MEKELVALFLVIVWTAAAKSQDGPVIHCTSQPPIKEGVLEIQLNKYATVICEHETGSSATLSNEFWSLSDNFESLMERRHNDLIPGNWEHVPCLFSENVANCNRFLVTIAATSQEFDGFETKGCTILSNGMRLCDDRAFTVRIIEEIMLPTSSLPLITEPPSVSFTDAATDAATGGWMSQLNQWANIFSLINITNNTLQTFLLIIVVLILKTSLQNKRKEKVDMNNGQDNLALRGKHVAPSYEMNDKGDEIDASLAKLLSNDSGNNDSAIDMTRTGRLNTKNDTTVRRQNSQH